MSTEGPLTPLTSLFEIPEEAPELPLPAELAQLYGELRFPTPAGPAYVIANFVETIDGVVSLNVPGKAGGAEISGFNRQDRMVMGLLRAAADAVLVGAGTLRAVPRHLWTAQDIYPPLGGAYEALRTALGKTSPPLNVFVTGRGEIDLGLRVFASGAVPVLIVTTPAGAGRLAREHIPPHVQVAAVEPGPDGRLRAGDILKAVSAHPRLAGPLMLVEGGPILVADFFGERCLDELFLTLAPQIAGRDASVQRISLVEGCALAPGIPVWGRLKSVKQSGSHLFLRYGFDTGGRPA